MDPFHVRFTMVGPSLVAARRETGADVRVGGLVGGLVLVVVAAGCTRAGGGPEPTASFVEPAAASSAPAWTEPPAYSFVLTRGCDPAAPLGRYRVVVRDRAVSGYQRLDRAEGRPDASTGVDLGPVTGGRDEEIEVPTLRVLLDLVRTAADDGGEVSQEFDARDGHPLRVRFNVSADPRAAECFSVADYAVAE